MRLLKKECPEDAIQSAPSAQDIEKQVRSHEESHVPAIEAHSSTMEAIDSEMERRVLRKLDLRVPTLMGFFCKTLALQRNINLLLTKHLSIR
jgi:hypothetical protein